MSRPTVTFPAELVDLFLEHMISESSNRFDKNAFQALIACTLTSRDFAYAARRQIFSTIVIDISPRNYLEPKKIAVDRTEEEMAWRIDTLISLLNQENSSLGHHVRKIQFVVDAQRIIFGRATSICIIILLRTLRDKALGLNIIHIAGRGRPLWWDKLPTQISNLIADLCRLSPISNLEFTAVRHIPATLVTVQQCPHLRIIDLKGSDFVTAGVDEESTVSITASFHPCGNYEVCYLPCGKLALTGIYVGIGDYLCSNLVSKLLSVDGVATSLHSFHCALWGDVDTLPLSIDFGRMPRLRELTITRKLRALPMTPASITNIIDALYRGNQTSQLEVMLIHITVHLYINPQDLDYLDYSDLKGLRLDYLLTKHPLIVEVTFRVDIELRFAKHGDTANAHRALSLKEGIKKQIRMGLTDGHSTRSSPRGLLPRIQIKVSY